MAQDASAARGAPRNGLKRGEALAILRLGRRAATTDLAQRHGPVGRLGRLSAQAKSGTELILASVSIGDAHERIAASALAQERLADAHGRAASPTYATLQVRIAEAETEIQNSSGDSRHDRLSERPESS